MPFTPEQAREIKKLLLVQVDKLPQENKEEIKEYIKHLNEKELEEFIKHNKIQIVKESSPDSSEKPIFQLIVEGKVPSYKIAENKKAIAVLEINPLSKGHILVLPKKQTTIEKMPKTVLSLAQKVAKKIKTKLKPDDIKIETSAFQNYPMVNVIPIYKDVPLKREKADEKELKKLKEKLETKKRKRVSKSPKIKEENIIKIGFRIP